MISFVLTGDSNTRDVDIAHTCSDAQTVANNIIERLSIIAGEARYDSRLGIRLKATKDELDLCVVRIVTETQGVVSILKFESVLSSREYKVNLNVATRFGDVEIWQAIK